MTEVKRKIRAAVYTRKSSEEGLEQEFNSLDAQREAGEAYIVSQRHEGWVLLKDAYDDGGFSGGSLERPGLKRLLADIEAGLIDVVVVYKIDRLTRSLSDFSRIIDTFEKHNVSFVSVTQQFNTTTSMGRLTLNILLSFAQFEREVTGERIRDKLAASKRKGMWVGGCPPLGYDIIDRKLVINEPEAAIIREIFKQFATLGSMVDVVRQLRKAGHRTKTWRSSTGRLREGRYFDKGSVYKILKSRLYLGEIAYKGQVYPGQHQAIIDRETWDKVEAIKQKDCPATRRQLNRHNQHALLKSVARCAGCDSGMVTTTMSKGKSGRVYRYYSPNAYLKKACEGCPIGHVPAGELEAVVFGQLKAMFKTPEMIVRVWEQAREYDPNVKEFHIRDAFCDIDRIWDELFPVEQERIVRLLVERIMVSRNGIDIRIRAGGLGSLVSQVRQMQTAQEAA
jgi:DNA invertase Pin-like site-specific DNA recombinase